MALLRSCKEQRAFRILFGAFVRSSYATINKKRLVVRSKERVSAGTAAEAKKEKSHLSDDEFGKEVASVDDDGCNEFVNKLKDDPDVSANK